MLNRTIKTPISILINFLSSIFLKFIAMNTFIIWYQFFNGYNWENMTIVRHNFSAALDRLESLQASASNNPKLYRNVECSFPELLEE